MSPVISLTVYKNHAGYCVENQGEEITVRPGGPIRKWVYFVINLEIMMTGTRIAGEK